jgi:hypothetical protein
MRPAALAAVSWVLAACSGGDVELTVSWTLLEGAEGEAPCPSSGELLISATEVDGGGRSSTVVPCTTTGTAVLAVQPVAHDVQIDVLSGGDVLVARSDLQRIEDDAGGVIDFEFPTLWGFSTFTWRVLDETGAEISCQDAGAHEITAIFREASLVTIGAFVQCGGGDRVDVEIAVGGYAVCAALRDVDGNAISTPVTLDSAIELGNETDDLGELVFETPPTEPTDVGLCADL